MAGSNVAGRFTEAWQKFKDWLSEQEWALELKGKWEELDAESRAYAKMGAGIAGILLVLAGFLSLGLRSRSLKNELRDKQRLLTFLQQSNNELRRLKEILPPPPAGGAADSASTQGWQPYLELQATQLGIDKAAIAFVNEKQSPAGTYAKETQLDINLTHVNLKQVVRLAYVIENGPKPTKLRSLTIDTKSDPTGYLDATLQVSGFVLNSK